MIRLQKPRRFEVTLRISATKWIGVVHAMEYFAEHWRGHIGDQTCNARGDVEGTKWAVEVVRTKERA